MAARPNVLDLDLAGDAPEPFDETAMRMSAFGDSLRLVVGYLAASGKRDVFQRVTNE